MLTTFIPEARYNDRMEGIVEAARKRLGMYVGDVTDGSGLHHEVLFAPRVVNDDRCEVEEGFGPDRAVAGHDDLRTE